MRPQQRRTWLALILTLAFGCGSGKAPVASGPAGAGPAPASAPLNLAELQSRPRGELAGLAEEWTERARLQEKAHREGKLPFRFLKQLRFPLDPPVFREAKFSAAVGFSLPPYHAGGDADPDLALHLARHGDVEAAVKLAGGDEARLRAFRGARNYPVEWTRLAGLLLHSAEFRLATGESEAAAELAALHGQVRRALDDKAARGALGAALLPRGRGALVEAEALWRKDGRKDLADAAAAALASWGEVPAVQAAVPGGAAKAEVERLLAGKAQGCLVAAGNVARAFDLLALPFPADGAEAVLAFFDGAGSLRDVLVTYRARTGETFPEPGQLALRLEEVVGAGKDTSREFGLRSRAYEGNGFVCEVTVVPRGDAAGALARWTAGASKPFAAALARDFGAVNLDRSFEQNRQRVAPQQSGDALQADRASVLAQVKNRLAPLELGKVFVHREPGQDVVSRLVLRGRDDPNQPPLFRVAAPLWAAQGPGRFDWGEDDRGAFLAVVWEDARTRHTLRLPVISGTAAEFEARDLAGAADTARRAATAAAADRAERKARLASGKPLTRLPRFVEVNWPVVTAPVRLGMTRADAISSLPAGQGFLRQDIPDGVSVVFQGAAPPGAAFVARQVLVRFDAAGRVAEVRANYGEGPAGEKKDWTKLLLDGLKKRGGAANESPSPWAALWPELPPRKPAPVLSTWSDDLTRMTYQRDVSGAEVALRDCPTDHPDGAPLPPLEFCPRGPQDCPLGIPREELLRRWKVARPVTTEEGALVLTPERGPYNALLVWFKGPDAVRVLARHSLPSNPSKPVSRTQAVTEAWGRDLRSLGWPRRQDLAPDRTVQSMGWNDERTRVRIFWSESDKGPQLFTEWREIADVKP